MKKPVVLMSAIIGGTALVVAVAAGAFVFLKHRHHTGPTVLAPAQQRALQVDFPQMVSPLEGGGLIQYTITLQASDAATKGEMTDMQPEIQDSFNKTMLQFTGSQLHVVGGFEKLKVDIKQSVNQLLPKGTVTKVEFVSYLVQ